jgi:hypothetical protein
VFTNELCEYCSIEQFSEKASQIVRIQTDDRLARLCIALSLLRTDSRLWSETVRSVIGVIKISVLEDTGITAL